MAERVAPNSVFHSIRHCRRRGAGNEHGPTVRHACLAESTCRNSSKARRRCVRQRRRDERRRNLRWERWRRSCLRDHIFKKIRYGQTPQPREQLAERGLFLEVAFPHTHKGAAANTGDTHTGNTATRRSPESSKRRSAKQRDSSSYYKKM